MCTHKANGEAAHFSVRWIRDRFVVFAGSKNVHLAARGAADVEKYREGEKGLRGCVILLHFLSVHGLTIVIPLKVHAT